MKLAFDADPIGRDLALIEDPRQPTSVGNAVAQFVAQEIARVDVEDAIRFGFALKKIITVNGRRSTALQEVNPRGGEIVAEWQSMVPLVLVWIAKTLDERSPVISGEYQRQHRVMADGVEFDVLGDIPQAREYVFYNAVPYARRIEIGKTEAGRDFVIQVAPRIYERTGKDARARFGNIARISTQFITPPNEYRLKRGSGKRSRRRDRGRGAVVNVPAIFVKVG